MRAFLIIGGLLTAADLAAAPIPKQPPKDPWVGRPLIIKNVGIPVTVRGADGSEQRAALATTSFYTVTKVDKDRVEATLATSAAKAVYVFRRDDVLTPAEAVTFFTDRLGKVDRDPLGCAYRGWAYYHEDQPDKAEADFTTAVGYATEEPFHSFFLRHRATIRMTGKKYAAAVEDFDALIERSPGYEWAVRQRASAKSSLGKHAEAIGELTTLLDTTRDRPAALLGRGLAYSRVGKWAEAMADYDAVATADPKNATAWNNKAWLRATCPDATFRNGQEAVEWATKACELTEWAHAGYLDTLAAACAEQGNFGKAVQWQRDAMRDKDLMRRDAADLKARLQLYTDGKPYRQPTEKK